jgi:polyisoprenoid-binding protein YceI
MTAPAAATTSTWTIDETHSLVEFAVKHMMITTVKGRFGTVSGTVTLPDGDVAKGSVQVRIATDSIDTRNEQRDGHLKSPDFFDVAQYPEITFASSSVTPHGDGWHLAGALTMHGVTRPVTLALTDGGQGKDPWGNERRSFWATGTIDRRDFGLTWNQTLETGGMLVSTDVKLHFEIQLVRAAA